jgi:hypothetical protein
MEARRVVPAAHGARGPGLQLGRVLRSWCDCGARARDTHACGAARGAAALRARARGA